jgi:hypothetical protein
MCHPRCNYRQYKLAAPFTWDKFVLIELASELAVLGRFTVWGLADEPERARSNAHGHRLRSEQSCDLPFALRELDERAIRPVATISALERRLQPKARVIEKALKRDETVAQI